MSNKTFKSSRYFRFTIPVIGFLISVFSVQAQDDIDIVGYHNIPLNTTETYNNFILSSNSSHLFVEGTLIVHGDFDMVGNQSQFEMGPEAVVIIYGNFSASNQISLNISSYLIIYGNFTKEGSSNQDAINVDDANIYIFGDVDNWGEDFENCEEYEGDTSDIDQEDCDYGTENEYEENKDTFPTEIIDELNCYDSTNPTFSWTGVEDSNWNNSANWSCYQLPDLGIDVIIRSNIASTNYPILNSEEVGLAKNITIEDSAFVEINGGNLEIAGDLLNNGIINAENGSIAFAGEIPQNIVSGEFQVENININNAAGVTSEAIIELIGILKVQTGNFYTGDQFSLVSSETKTALIDGSGDGEVIGLVKMQRYLDEAFGYKYFSSPFQNSVVGDFEPFMDILHPDTNFPHFYRYYENRREEGLDQDATGWEAYIDPAGTLNIAEGYAVNFGNTNDPVTVQLEGEVNNGIISKNLQHNNREWTKGFNLIGNPYPSPIDWDAPGWTKENIDDGIYFFTAGNDQYTGTYTSYLNGISSTDGKSSNIIPSMQGFFVKVSDPEIEGNTVNANLGMTNKIRIADFQQEFIRAPQSPTKPLLRLKADFENAEKPDAIVIYFSPHSTPNFEKEMDAHKLMNTDVSVPNIYSISRDQKELSINAIPMPVSGAYEKVSLGIKVEKSGRMTISLADVEYLNSGFNIYLIDLEKKIGQNLNRKPEYSFNISEGIDNSRFQLMFSEEKINDRAIAFDELFSVKINQGILTVKLNLEEGQKGKLQLSTITGQVLEEKVGHGKERVKFSTINNSGVYFINLYVGEQRISKKVLIKQ